MSFRFGMTTNSFASANESTNITCSATRTLIIRDVLSAMLSWNWEVSKSFYATQSRNVWKIIAKFLSRLNSCSLESCSDSREHLTGQN